jgi:hypothetical protein
MKLNKRDFVKGAAAAAVVGSGFLYWRRDFDIAVYNDWFPQARAFAAKLSERGTRVLPVEGDAGRLWYGTLRGLIAAGHRRIAGLTTHIDLLILETLARDPGLVTGASGLRVTQRESAGRLVSWVLI